MTVIDTLKTTLTPGTWTIDPTHSEVGFVARHLMVTKVRGSFTDVSGTVEVAEDIPGRSPTSPSRPPRSTAAPPTATPTCAAPTSSTSTPTRTSPSARPRSTVRPSPVT